MTQVFTSASTKDLKAKKKGTTTDSFVFYLTMYDSSLRERKYAIVKLLEVVGLKPQAGADLHVKNAITQMQEEALKVTKQPVKKVKEIVGDGEEIELEDAEVLSDNDIEAIYQKLVQQLIHLPKLNNTTFTKGSAQRSEYGRNGTCSFVQFHVAWISKASLIVCSPTNILTLSLTSLIRWMHSLENGDMDAREATSMHPLWSQ